jgi:hypothetical protein
MHVAIQRVFPLLCPIHALMLLILTSAAMTSALPGDASVSAEESDAPEPCP